jgi:uncharacterized membrane protein
MKRISILLGILLLLSACSKKPVYPEAPFDGSSIRIELADLPEKKPVFFTFFSNKLGINFFLLKRNGDIESYFDACGKCFPRKLGFRHADNRVVCRACDVSYRLDDLKDGIGSCYPIKLKGRVEGKTFVINRKDILEGERFF